MDYEIKFNPMKNNRPYFSIKEDSSYWYLNELNLCDPEYIIDDVLPSISKVMNGELNEFEFGYDATIVDFSKDKSVINYNYFSDRIEIPTEELFRFMKEWGTNLITWRQNKL